MNTYTFTYIHKDTPNSASINKEIVTNCRHGQFYKK